MSFKNIIFCNHILIMSIASFILFHDVQSPAIYHGLNLIAGKIIVYTLIVCI